MTQPDAVNKIIRRARCIVMWDEQHNEHVYLEDADIAFGQSVAAIGNDLQADGAEVIDGRDFLVMPGLVNIHSHPGEEPLNKGLWDEVGSPWLYNTSLYEYLMVLDRDLAGTRAAYRVAFAELLRSGVTTICDLAVPTDDWLDVIASTGIRACVAPMFRQARWVTENGHRLDYAWDLARGREGFERALKEIAAAARHPSGRLFGMIAPSQIDTCDEELLQDAHAEAVRLDIPFQTHAGQSLTEFHEMTRRHGLTPIGFMKKIGILSERTIIGHGIFLDHHPWVRWPKTDDLGSIANAGATVAHCPTVFARRGIMLDHIGLYRQRGVNLGIGTDVYPNNMLDEMRLAIYAGRLMAGNPRDATLADVFAAATVGGAKALRRPDIGRIAPGAKADLVMVDCRAPVMQPCRDPLRSLVFSASDRAVRHVFVDGDQVVKDGVVLTVDEAEAAAALYEAQCRAVKGVPRNDWAGRTIDQLAPPSHRWA
ncbi:amidohydrolase family protein [Sinorhizobium medicae]|uniref:N-ethylammeline chlorohydrolase n=2 Tax=Sinorhizobium medicae TaxID=110321 RepID=A0ABX4TVG1_9HYPH|nr:amidohydrolase family protein [Sinorhizobium medicae]MQV99156.1 amidohydrolase family protein [Sinorhizobium medicae]PLU09317.1 N-ethylammeline chlorohydrolase [Sinorhizobium medicae]PLU24879.1 N-ethylammeline chlorohydrolase [Sinorhizobium medicae]